MLTPEQVEIAQQAFDYGIAHPGPASGTAASAEINTEAGEKFYTDVSNAENWTSEEFHRLLIDTPIGDAVAEIFDSPDVWFYGEQLFWKEGGHITATPWHQDTSFGAIEGPDLAIAWVSLDHLKKESSLEFVRGSHKGPTHNGYRPGAADRTEPYYDDPNMPRMPDVESRRKEFDIISWPIEPGDVVLFNFNTLHGGAATYPGLRRRTISLRFFGSRAWRVQRPPTPNMGKKLDFSFAFFDAVNALDVGQKVSSAAAAFRVRP
jgi:ectoine hydroxylase-related dioxygenase (phytanoyl-CoA dioxygenase family)